MARNRLKCKGERQERKGWRVQWHFDLQLSRVRKVGREVRVDLRSMW